MGKVKWTHDKIREEALKYDTRSNFALNSQSAFNGAKRLKILDDVCSHMPWNGGIRWTYEEAKTEALKYDSKISLSKNNRSLYTYMQRNNIVYELCNHMVPLCVNWTTDMLIEEALKYSTRNEFKHGSSKAYIVARSRQLLNTICTHMEFVHNRWTNETLAIEALKYNTIIDFIRANQSAYQMANNRNILKEICSHMICICQGFNPNKPAILYYIKFIFDEITLYKIGITNFSASDRIKTMGINQEYSTTILLERYYENGADAYAEEQNLHKNFKDHQYTGIPIMNNGNTELFIKDVLGLDI